MQFNVDIDNMIPDFVHKVKVLRLAKQVFKQNKVKEFMLPHFNYQYNNLIFTSENLQLITNFYCGFFLYGLGVKNDYYIAKGCKNKQQQKIQCGP